MGKTIGSTIPTQDELFTAELNLAGWQSAAAKEVTAENNYFFPCQFIRIYPAI
jgi:hypothetical protein